MATIEDVAKLAGVPRSTVSGAFSGKKRMSSERREEILRIARELRYEPNLLAQRLGSRGGHDVVAVLAIPDFSLETRTLQFLVHQLDKEGIEVECTTPPYFAHEAAERQVALFNRIRRLQPRAVVLSLSQWASADFIGELRRFAEEGGTLVGYAHGQVPEFGDWVVFDRYQSTYDAIRHLIEQGHRRLGYNSHGRAVAGDDRVRAFRDALAESDIPVREEWIWGNCCYEDGGVKLAQEFLALKERPTGLQIINDHTASAFVNALFRAGVRVPDDVSVIGNENTPAAAAALVPLTTVTFPHREVGLEVVEMLKSRLNGSYQGPPRIVWKRGELIQRDSVAAVPS